MAANGNSGSRGAAGDGRLRSWKEIAGYFGADERTAKRWETTRGLPIHRVPGDARAPVFAYEAELAAWLRSRGEPAAAAAVAPVAAPARRPVWLAAAGVMVALLALVAWWGWQRAASERQSADARTADVRQLARSQIALLSDRLERQSGTVRLRAALAQEAAAMLGRVADAPDASPELRREAAEAYRRLATVQNATDRPSLRDRAAARGSLDTALRLLTGDPSPAAAELRVRVLIDAARQAAADGALAKAPAMLAAARAGMRDPPLALRDELALADSEIAQWQGDYAAAIAAAERVYAQPADAAGWLRQVRARDLAAEARFYARDNTGALAGYRAAVTLAEEGWRRFPGEPAFRWAVHRQHWNLGTTLLDMDLAAVALPLLASARDGWLAMAQADPQDETLLSWVRTTRLSYGEGLAAAGRIDAAVTELSDSVADRRAWLMARPAAAERQRALIVGLNALGTMLGNAGRRGEACGLFRESGAIAQRMAKASSLTRLDGDSVVRTIGEGAAKYCRPIDGAARLS